MNDEFLSNDSVVVQFVDKLGNLNEKENELCCGIAIAKIITTTKNEESSVKYKVAIYNGAIYQPSGPYSTREKGLKEHFTFRLVPKVVFDNYLQYLKTRKGTYYLLANRGITNV